eukprot:scaffold18154_cov30-Phaeocystis_antarctica.AAC.1
MTPSVAGSASAASGSSPQSCTQQCRPRQPLPAQCSPPSSLPRAASLQQEPDHCLGSATEVTAARRLVTGHPAVRDARLAVLGEGLLAKDRLASL